MQSLERHLHPVADKPRHKEHCRPIRDILTDPSKPIPSRFLEQRKQGGAKLDFIPWYNVCRLLDYYAPCWHGHVKAIITTNDRLFMTYSLTLEAEEGSFTREATGTELLKELDRKTGELREIAYRDPSSRAESMSLRRAAAKFGLGLYLYDR